MVTEHKITILFYRAILSKSQRLCIHIQNTKDGVTLREPRQGKRCFSIMVQISTVCTIQPHVSS